MSPSWAQGAFYLRHGQPLVHQDATGKPVKVVLDTKIPANFIDVILGKDSTDPPVCGLRVISDRGRVEIRPDRPGRQGKDERLIPEPAGVTRRRASWDRRFRRTPPP